MTRTVLATFILFVVSTSCYSAGANDVPEQLRVPADETLLLQATGKGVQIYECVATADQAARFEWKLKAPEAELFDTQGRKIGKHYAGPTWELSDASAVVGTLKARSESPDAHAIPWLLLEAKSTSGSGVLSAAKSIQRLNTTGGKAPDEGCDKSNAQQQIRVPYSAEYYFYGMKR